MLLAQPHPGHQQGILVVLGMPDHGCLNDPVVPAFRPVPSDQDVALDRVWASFDGNSFRRDDRRCEGLQNRRRVRHVGRHTHTHDDAPRTKGAEYDTTLERFELAYTGIARTPRASWYGVQPPASYSAGWWNGGRQTVSTVAPFLSASTEDKHTFRRNANIADAVSVPVGTHSDNQSRGVGESRPEREARHGPIGECDNPDARVATGPRDLIDTAPGVLRGTEQTPGASHSRSYTRHSIQIARPVRPPVAGAAQADDGRTSVVRTYSRGASSLVPAITARANAGLSIPMRRAGDSRRGGRWRAMEKQAAARQFSHDALRYGVDALPAHSRISKSVSRASRLPALRAATPNDNMPSVLDHGDTGRAVETCARFHGEAIR